MPPSCSKGTKYYRKDRPNNLSAKGGQPSINCQGHSQRNKCLFGMLTEYQINLMTFGIAYTIMWRRRFRCKSHPILKY
uniref:Ovule protein n=1 Tax=Heterorhabditis bacteriophora TaxID=37862 RepID=A0A1I7W6V5_HETBA